jgi:Reverse transcriptase (RNA-dependent DNA polymerase)
MPVRFENFDHSFLFNAKPVFVPNLLGRRIGNDIKHQVETSYKFDEFYYHLRAGGHLAALHAHRENKYFAKIDIENFFYSIGRNRVVRSLRDIQIARPAHYGKWSCVKSPFHQPSYSLPYGFIQSPILASLVLARSELGTKMKSLSKRITVSIYMDDIAVSGNDLIQLGETLSEIIEAANESNFKLNDKKTKQPSEIIDIFNCILKKEESYVTDERVAEFNSKPRSSLSSKGFERYCGSVVKGNR